MRRSQRRAAMRLLFFFQAEDGIRDLTVTGVQTCALPICADTRKAANHLRAADVLRRRDGDVESIARHLIAALPEGGPRETMTWADRAGAQARSEEHTSELQSQSNLVCRLLLEKKKKTKKK